MLLLDFFPFYLSCIFKATVGGVGGLSADPQMDSVHLYSVEMCQKGRKGEQKRHYCCFKDIPFVLEALC